MTLKEGRVTIPTNLDVVPETIELMKRWGADAIRDCVSRGTGQNRGKNLCHLLYYPEGQRVGKGKPG